MVWNLIDFSCTICLEDSGNPVEIELECCHVFHSECISEWLSREKHCPVCKRDMDLGKLKWNDLLFILLFIAYYY